MDIDIHSQAPETKAGIGGGSAATHDDVMRLFEEFKSANDQRLDEIERRSADGVTADKVERINAALSRRLDELTLKSARPGLGLGASGGRERGAQSAVRSSTRPRSTATCARARARGFARWRPRR